MKYTTWRSQGWANAQLLFPLIILGCLIPLTAEAQITPDNSLGDESSVVTPLDAQGIPVDQIDGGATRGANLFHSFQDFNVAAGRGAFFSNPPGINNIFSRVTGTNVSNINGVLGVVGGNANLFLINPNGIIFGQNARLSLGGSFFASTADSLLFDNNFEFSASNPTAPPLLEVSIPIGLNFRDNPGEIVNRSFVQNNAGDFVGLEVAPGQNLTLLGGNINFDSGAATARGGNIELGGLSEAGTATFNDDGSLSFPEGVARADVTFTNFADVDVRAAGGGSIIINASNIELLGGEFGGSQLRAGILTDSGSTTAQAGDITLNALEEIEIADSFIFNTLGEETLGIGGNIEIQTRSLNLTNGSAVVTFTAGNGNAGNVAIQTTDLVSIENNSNLSAFSAGDGVGGNISLTVEQGNLNIQSGGVVTTDTIGSGNAGDILINARDAVEVSNGEITSISRLPSTGNAGAINIDTRELIVEGDSEISTDTLGIGQGGDLTITASELVRVTGIPDDGFRSVLSSLTTGEGNAGEIKITTNQLVVEDNASISADTLNSGNAGNINIQSTESIFVDNGAIGSQAQQSSGNGGDIVIQTEELTVEGESDLGLISTSTLDIGNSGNIILEVGKLNILRGGGVFASTSSTGNAGNITVRASDFVEVIGTTANGELSSRITTEVNNQATGDGGQLLIDTNRLLVRDGGQIRAGTMGEGQGGTLTVIATDSVEILGTEDVIPGGLFTEATNGGTAGNLTLETGELTIANGASVTVSSPQGLAGNLNIKADSLSQNQGDITAETGISEGDIGANINLEIFDIWRIENESLVSATAFGDADGGNININTDPNLSNTELILLAFPPTGVNGSDIIANAEQGIGGRIDITAAGVFGIDFRDEQTPLNDFTVTSEFGQSGETIINRTVDDPTSGLIELPQAVGDASDQISQNPCQQGVGSEFILTGKGGLPPNVNEALNSEEAQVGLIEAVPSRRQGDGETGRQGDRETGRQGDKGKQSDNLATEAMPAMGWVFNDKGEVTLTAYKTTDTEIQRSGEQYSSTCKSRIAP